MKRTISAAVALLAASLVSIAATGSPAMAYCATSRKWSSPASVKIRAAASIPTSWDSILSASTAQWRGISGATFGISVMGRNVSGPIYGGGLYKSAAPNGFGGAPGITVFAQGSTSNTSANIYLDPGFAWNTSGTMDQAHKNADVRTILVHELGHWVTLDHPSQCGSMTTDEVNAAMNPNWKKKWNTNADDKAGTAAMS